MAEDERPDTEPESSSKEEKKPSPKRRQSLGKVRRELDEEELSSASVQKMLLDELDRLDEEVEELKSFKDQFHEADKDVGILKEKVAKHKALDIFSSGALIVGASLVGYAQTLPDPVFLMALGAVLIVAGLWAKAVHA